MSSERGTELLRGSIDVHMHTAPDVYERSVTALEAAAQAKAAGMRAIVLKSHSTDTADRAELVSALADFPVFGGVVLNHAVGGLNPHAVVECARQGGRFVWMPTTSARHFLARAAAAPMLHTDVSPDDGLVVSVDGELLPEAEAVLALVAEHDLALCSGHLEPSETLLLFRRARELGVERLIATHPHAPFVAASTDEVLALADLGAVCELNYAFCTQAISEPQPVAHVSEMIREVGVERCLLATDGGQAGNPVPVEMMRAFLGGLLELGFEEEELRTMVAEVPARLLALDGG